MLADVIIQTAPSTAAATHNAAQNLLSNTPEPLKEGPERLVIAVTLTAVAVGGYLLRERLQKK